MLSAHYKTKNPITIQQEFTGNADTETVISSSWRTFRHSLHRKLITYGATSDKNFAKIRRFTFQWTKKE